MQQLVKGLGCLTEMAYSSEYASLQGLTWAHGGVGICYMYEC